MGAMEMSFSRRRSELRCDRRLCRPPLIAAPGNAQTSADSRSAASQARDAPAPDVQTTDVFDLWRQVRHKDDPGRSGTIERR